MLKECPYSHAVMSVYWFVKISGRFFRFCIDYSTVSAFSRKEEKKQHVCNIRFKFSVDQLLFFNLQSYNNRTVEHLAIKSCLERI